MVHLEAVVVVVDLWPHLDLFEVHHVLVLAGLARATVLFVLELAVIHDAAHGRARSRRHLDEIEPLGLGHGERFSGGDHSHLLTVVPDDTNLGDADALVDAGLRRLAQRQ